MTSEIHKEMVRNLKEMEKLIAKQKFTVEDAQSFLTRYYNIARKMEELEKSRDNWKNKYVKLKYGK